MNLLIWAQCNHVNTFYVLETIHLFPIAPVSSCDVTRIALNFLCKHQVKLNLFAFPLESRTFHLM